MERENIVCKETNKRTNKQLYKQIRTVNKKQSLAKSIGREPIATFGVLITVTIIISIAVAQNRLEIERFTMERLAMEQSTRVSTLLQRMFQRGYIFGQLVESTAGENEGLVQLAYNLADDAAIMNLSIAPGGIVSEAFPLGGNEALIGLDFFAEKMRNTGYTSYESSLLSRLAKETGTFVIGGPFTSIQGPEILVGRYPVFLYNEQNERFFWGLVGITLMYPEALDASGLYNLTILGYEYEIWRYNPYDKNRQILAGGIEPNIISSQETNIPLDVLNAQWYLRVVSTSRWYHFAEPWFAFAVGFVTSISIAVLIFFLKREQNSRKELLILSTLDPLTKIYNRRYFMDIAGHLNKEFSHHHMYGFIIMFDLDHFKKINDTYGHQAGDKVLIEVADLVNSLIREDDVLARYGGEEFIIFASEVSADQVMQLAERIRVNVEQTSVRVGEHTINVTISVGVSHASPHNILEDAINLADVSLYKAKEKGRNQIVFLDRR